MSQFSMLSGLTARPMPGPSFSQHGESWARSSFGSQPAALAAAENVSPHQSNPKQFTIWLPRSSETSAMKSSNPLTSLATISPIRL